MTENDIHIPDRLDYRIMQILATEARSSDVAIGEQIGLSSNAVARRRKLLEDRGFIGHYAAAFDLELMGYGTLVIVQFELVSQSDEALRKFEMGIQSCQSISKCWFISGDIDFLAILHVPSLNDYDETYRKELSTLPNVSKIRSSFALRKVMDRSIAPRIIFPAPHRLPG